MGITWEKQISREADWWFSHQFPHLAIISHMDWFKYIYKTYGTWLYDKKFENALEIGPGGSGGYLPLMKGITNRFAVEPIADQLREKGFLPFTSHIHYINCFAEEIPLGADFADLIVMSNALDHVKDVNKTLSEVNRILKKGGIIFFFTFLKVKKPHPTTWYSSNEVNDLFKDYELIEGHFIKSEGVLDSPRSDYYVAIYRK